ncbi:hypothetical protein K457DRAFT_488153 [Linnemannia elongata AG-77]|uniref:Uncharacterized protein n=1 Tax=Linnemannia elongata AG-77 TaxID=1314771 RepID=A0A197JXZ5_9FUNG|nr:hypothetical protein K457DRAFT_488153 [Linnemannia elongata AG-77]
MVCTWPRPLQYFFSLEVGTSDPSRPSLSFLVVFVLIVLVVILQPLLTTNNDRDLDTYSNGSSPHKSLSTLALSTFLVFVVVLKIK